MAVEHVTTPFGARGLSRGMLKAQHLAATCPEKAEAGKWQVLRDLTIARRQFAISDRAVTVLSALLSFLPQEKMRADCELLVFPSNAELSRRAHGISEATLRRCLAQLVEAGLLIRRDSPNGKRYARRNADGSVAKAFGFDLRPLLARVVEIGEAAAAAMAERNAIALLREEITLLRRDVRKTLAFAMEDGIDDEWDDVLTAFQACEGNSNRGLTLHELSNLAAELRTVSAAAEKLLERMSNFKIMYGNDVHYGRHKQDSNQTPFSDLESAAEKPTPGDAGADQTEEDDAAELPDPVGSSGIARAKRLAAAGKQDGKLRSKVPLDLVLRACPDIRGYAKHEIRSWNDLREAAGLVRAVLGISPDAWREAEEVMGGENAAATVAAILQRAEVIRSPGGYLRTLSDRAAEGTYSPAPVIHALLRY
ncbi:replication initiation protein RepC [Rhizobiaceae bacterium n13]|uniref:Replication initiation protein RepC n=1 Tax=Ferirhizobium litorale TaxID=2927786 RepID=A0AAE3U2X6_9HYPH|nr:plasmid replication protein RepC [Fererhizobium litorale]MDI7861896.1 replication initiation protein RepC [Fererhizobium litorale]MDI7921763.1 replication initiation protein RepC [Fererhizobium litorale]